MSRSEQDSPAQEGFSPTAKGERIQSLDVLRGVAVLGILTMNVVAFGLPSAAYYNPATAGGSAGANLYAWMAGALLFEGTMRTLFSVLFGAGVVLLSQRAERRELAAGGADIYFRRNMWLIAFGAVHGYLLLWSGDILYTYGIAGLLLYVFRKLPPRTLLICGFVVLAILVPKRLLRLAELEELRDGARAAQRVEEAGGELSDEQLRLLERWRLERPGFAPRPEDIDTQVQRHRRGYVAMVRESAAGVRRAHTTSLYDAWLFDSLGVMLMGMALLKLGVLSAERSTAFYLALTGGGYAVGLLVNCSEVRAIMLSGFDPFTILSTEATYDLGRLTVAAGHLGLVMLLCRWRLLPGLARCLAATGRMALTNYVAQTIFCTLIFNGYGLSWFGRLERWQLYLVVAGIWVVQLVASPLWLRYFRFGPLEWAWRSLGYWQRQPLVIRGERYPVSVPQ